MPLVFATNNPNKIKEVTNQLAASFPILTLDAINCKEDIPETSPTIEGNALQKARYIKETYGYDCFADDTGLEVASLDGAPGVYSARYAGPQKNAEDNIQKLLQALKNHNNRKARFKTVIALVMDGKEYLFTGECPGTITKQKYGTAGFGYDPIFQPDGYTQTFAQMPLEIKNQIGHRGKAVTKLTSFLKQHKES